MTQDQLADALGVDAATIKRREHPRGHEHLQSPKKGERLAIAQVCGVPVEFLEEGFGGQARDELSEQLAGLKEELAQMALDATTREMATQRRLDEVVRAIDRSQRQQQP